MSIWYPHPRKIPLNDFVKGDFENLIFCMGVNPGDGELAEVSTVAAEGRGGWLVLVFLTGPVP